MVNLRLRESAPPAEPRCSGLEKVKSGYIPEIPKAGYEISYPASCFPGTPPEV